VGSQDSLLRNGARYWVRG